MVTMLTNFSDSSSGIGALGFNGKDFLIQLITFVLAFLILKRYAFAPVIKVLRERREVIDQGVKLGEQMKLEQAEMEAKVEATLHKSRVKADDIIAGAKDTAKQTILEAENSAKDKAAGILDSAQERIVQDTARARTQLEKEIVGLVSDVTEAVIEEKVDAKKDAQLIERALKGQRA